MHGTFNHSSRLCMNKSLKIEGLNVFECLNNNNKEKNSKNTLKKRVRFHLFMLMQQLLGNLDINKLCFSLFAPQHTEANQNIISLFLLQFLYFFYPPNQHRQGRTASNQ